LAATVENLKKYHLLGVPAKIQTRYFPNTSQKHYNLRKYPSGHSREKGVNGSMKYSLQKYILRIHAGLNSFRRAPRTGIFPEQTNNLCLLNPINSDLNTLCVNTAFRFKCPTRGCPLHKKVSPHKNIHKK
jgi:hypothetical protein